ncbi:hypothetical protein T440DRAFT_514120 [Plenodomus tracheiphilus IPT5]|uniref:Uncharacterized protein n=1 Tax=Plenodomus tracheiphilus IPT5 TaxID=1408161 RepID=A0A6A7BIJ9_9PLEO|nr:hypothetical protein T440DRAFT_514120 [Plenodomus tracheiphilus IPT5]
MRFPLALAALAAFAAAVPIELATDGKYNRYISYNPYTTYGPYPAAADAEGARMQFDAHVVRTDSMLHAPNHDKAVEMMKRHAMMMEHSADMEMGVDMME